MSTSVPLDGRHRKMVGSVVRELLDARSFLALELEEAHGIITTAQFEQLALPFYHDLRPYSEALDVAKALFAVGDIDVDSEELGVVLRCSSADAARILSQLSLTPDHSRAGRLNDGNPG